MLDYYSIEFYSCKVREAASGEQSVWILHLRVDSPRDQRAEPNDIYRSICLIYSQLYSITISCVMMIDIHIDLLLL